MFTFSCKHDDWWLIDNDNGSGWDLWLKLLLVAYYDFAAIAKLKKRSLNAYYILILMKGYECTKILIDILLRRLKGLKRYKAGVALKRKMTFPLFNTMKVWEKEIIYMKYSIVTCSLQHTHFSVDATNHILYTAVESHSNPFNWPCLKPLVR